METTTNIAITLQATTLPALFVCIFPHPAGLRDCELGQKDVLPLLRLIPGLAGKHEAERIWHAASDEVYSQLMQREIPRRQCYDAATRFVAEQSGIVDIICQKIKECYPYFGYFEHDWAICAILWSRVWNGRIRELRRTPARRAREESLEV